MKKKNLVKKIKSATEKWAAEIRIEYSKTKITRFVTLWTRLETNPLQVHVTECQTFCYEQEELVFSPRKFEKDRLKIIALWGITYIEQFTYFQCDGLFK